MDKIEWKWTSYIQMWCYLGTQSSSSFNDIYVRNKTVSTFPTRKITKLYSKKESFKPSKSFTCSNEIGLRKLFLNYRKICHSVQCIYFSLIFRNELSQNDQVWHLKSCMNHLLPVLNTGLCCSRLFLLMKIACL